MQGANVYAGAKELILKTFPNTVESKSIMGA
jgi:hypothetical protein